jgi:hypothetical protein
VWAAAACPAAAAPAIDVEAIRSAAQASVCRVSARNAWGIPVATATGFLIGDGRFVVTDLGTVARPAIARVRFDFAEGSAAATQFAMADPALGLVVLAVEGRSAQRTGLPLAAALPPLDGTAPVAAAGWRWGSQLDVLTGRLGKGPAIREVAALTRVDTPPGVDAFVRMEGARMEVAGAPVLDAGGTVVAVTMEVTVRDTSAALAIPASSLRSALLGAQPQLKALAELPKPLWPSRLLRIAGCPAASRDCSAAVAQVRAAMTCSNCGGKGKLLNPDFVSGLSFTPLLPCPKCYAEGVVAQDTVVKALALAIEGATRTLWAPVADERSRTTARAAGTEIIKSLALAGPLYQRDYAAALAPLLGKGPLPQGVVFHGEVRRKIEGPDGRYVVLAPRGADTPVAVRLDDLLSPGVKSAAAAARKEPAEKTWVVLAGTAIAPFQNERATTLFVLPLDWAPATAPAGPQRGARP